MVAPECLEAGVDGERSVATLTEMTLGQQVQPAPCTGLGKPEKCERRRLRGSMGGLVPGTVPGALCPTCTPSLSGEMGPSHAACGPGREGGRAARSGPCTGTEAVGGVKKEGGSTANVFAGGEHGLLASLLCGP